MSDDEHPHGKYTQNEDQTFERTYEFEFPSRTTSEWSKGTTVQVDVEDDRALPHRLARCDEPEQTVIKVDELEAELLWLSWGPFSGQSPTEDDLGVDVESAKVIVEFNEFNEE